MTLTSENGTPSTLPDVSFIMPCYNEEEVIGWTIPACRLESPSLLTEASS